MKIWKVASLNVSLLLMLTLIGCGAHCTAVAPANPVIPPLSAGPDVYVAGWQFNGAGTKVAMLWKNGIATSLTDGTYGAYATSVAVLGSDIYVTLNEASGYDGNFVAELWKNGSITDLTDGTLSGDATAVAISGSDVYVAGGQSGFDSNNNFIGFSGYWKNGIFTTLVTDDVQTQVSGGPSSITIVGSDVYLAGDTTRMVYTSPTSDVVAPAATYWKNGVPVVLTDGLTYASASSIAVSGTDVYVAGLHCMTLSNDCSYAAYWKNGVEVDLSGPEGLLTGIAVTNGMVYASGEQTDTRGNNYSEYWAGANPVQLANSIEAGANGIVLYGSDVYVVGAIAGAACYWKNGNVQPVADGPSLSTGNAIVVVAP